MSHLLVCFGLGLSSALLSWSMAYRAAAGGAVPVPGTVGGGFPCPSSTHGCSRPCAQQLWLQG